MEKMEGCYTLYITITLNPSGKTHETNVMKGVIAKNKTGVVAFISFFALPDTPLLICR